MDYYGPEKEEATAVVAESMPDFNAGETVCFSESSFHSIWELVYMGDGIEKNLVLDRFPYIIGKWNLSEWSSDSNEYPDAITGRRSPDLCHGGICVKKQNGQVMF